MVGGAFCATALTQQSANDALPKIFRRCFKAPFSDVQLYRVAMADMLRFVCELKSECNGHLQQNVRKASPT